ncbi:hypothetical protein ACOJUY_004292 [Vibrio alginolyticus]|nr:hypothetical protein [Vibrio alginolyticus]EHA1137155.1 hypothetical protein [Vibrio alginolyticus]UFN72792.1 hypothetical protein LN249_24080 [Vibrio alginolyticus]
MRTVIIVLAIVFAGFMISNSIQQASLPDNVKQQQYEAEQEKKAEQEKNDKIKKAEREVKRKKEQALIEAASNMSWKEIYHLPREQKYIVSLHYAFEIVKWFSLIFVGLVIWGRIIGAKKGNE